MTPAPVALFAYNRPQHLRKTLESLAGNILADETELFIFCDGPKPNAGKEALERIHETRSAAREQPWCKVTHVFENEKNSGLAGSIINGVTIILSEYSSVIVLEDDMVTSKYFLKYMNECLDIYEQEDRVISIHGYVYPIGGLPETFFLRGADCWGWATWQRGWELFEPDGKKLLHDLEQKKLCYRFDFNGGYPYTTMLKNQTKGKVDSWAILWYASVFLKDKLTLYPGRSLVSNIGNDSSGTNVGSVDWINVSLDDKPIEVGNILIEECEACFDAIRQYLKKNAGRLTLKSILKSLKSRILKWKT